MTNNLKTAEKETVTLIDAIDETIARRVRWEQGNYAAANTELYALLADCLDLFFVVKRSYELPRSVNLMLDERGIKHTAGTSLELKLVRLVFANEHTAKQAENRLFGYARVIRAAADAKQTSATLAKFITDNHGIDEIRRASKGGMNSTQKLKSEIEQARAELITPNSAELFSNFALPNTLQPKDGEHYSLALVRKNSDGTGSIVFGTNNVAAINNVLAIAGKELKAEAIKAAEDVAAKNLNEVKQRKIEKLTAEIGAAMGSGQPKFKPEFTLSQTEGVFA